MSFFLEVLRKLMSKVNFPQLALSCIFVDVYRFPEYISLYGSWWACIFAAYTYCKIKDYTLSSRATILLLAVTYSVWSNCCDVFFNSKYSLRRFEN